MSDVYRARYGKKTKTDGPLLAIGAMGVLMLVGVIIRQWLHAAARAAEAAEDL
eukprot:SAG22_NODE_1885_length_3376_cov_1.712542_1_plen_53_part_00